jgi:hypothetical protein
MSIKSKALAAAATLTLVGGVAAVGTLAAGTAKAATPSCGDSCINIFSREFGTHFRPNFVVDVLRQGERVGQPIILFRTSNSDPAEDWTVSFQGLVSDFYAAGLVSAQLNLHYGDGSVNAIDQPALEIEYAPFGVDSGLCMGLGSTAFNGENVSLQPCGVSSKTVWVVDVADSPDTLDHGYVPLINGSDTNFSHPFVLSYPQSGFPTDMPRPILKVTNLTGFSNGFGPIVGTVPDWQLWGADFGVLP